jgi:adenylate cyclase
MGGHASHMPFRRFFPPHPCLDRLEHLIAARLQPGADKVAIDATLWREFGTTLAVMFTDLSGFSRHVAHFGIVHFLEVIHEAARLHVPCIDRHGGRLLKAEGDSMLVTFESADVALAAAEEMQAVSAEFNRTSPPENAVLLCIGLGYGPMLKIGNADVYGAEVNAASKLGEDTAQAGEILMTDGFHGALSVPVLDRAERLDFVPPGASGAWRWLNRRDL